MYKKHDGMGVRTVHEETRSIRLVFLVFSAISCGLAYKDFPSLLSYILIATASALVILLVLSPDNYEKPENKGANDYYKYKLVKAILEDQESTNHQLKKFKDYCDRINIPVIDIFPYFAGPKFVKYYADDRLTHTRPLGFYTVDPYPKIQGMLAEMNKPLDAWVFNCNAPDSDPHPGVEAHEIMGQMLYDLLLKEKIIDKVIETRLKKKCTPLH